MKHKMIVLSMLLVAIFLSCKKEDLSVAGNSDAFLLSKVKVDNKLSNEYLFNDANSITEEKSKFDFKVHHYNEKNQVVSTDFYGNFDLLSSDMQVYQTALSRTEWVTAGNGTKGGTVKYEYNDNGQLIKTSYSGTISASSEYSEFSYDINNRISKQVLYWENKQTGYIEYSYDGKGNLIKEILYNLPSSGVVELNTITRYEFDSEQNPFKSFSKLMTPGINTNLNNIIKETYTIHMTPDQGPDKVQVTETSYEYNGSGYPVRKNGNVEYIYELLPTL